jgi:hypothetical protein
MLRRVFLDEKKTTFKMTRWVKNGEPVYIPHFSTDVKDAFLLVETMRKEGWVFHLSSLADGYKATLQRSGTWGLNGLNVTHPIPNALPYQKPSPRFASWPNQTSPTGISGARKEGTILNNQIRNQIQTIACKAILSLNHQELEEVQVLMQVG